MRTVAAKTTAWLSDSSSFGLQDMVAGDPDSVVNGLVYVSHDMSGHGWVKVGTAEITVTIESADTIIANKIVALGNEKASILARAQKQATEIEGQIQQLLAIEYKPEAA